MFACNSKWNWNSKDMLEYCIKYCSKNYIVYLDITVKGHFKIMHMKIFCYRVQ